MNDKEDKYQEGLDELDENIENLLGTLRKGPKVEFSKHSLFIIAADTSIDRARRNTRAFFVNLNWRSAKSIPRLIKLHYQMIPGTYRAAREKGKKSVLSSLMWTAITMMCYPPYFIMHNLLYKTDFIVPLYPWDYLRAPWRFLTGVDNRLDLGE